MANILLPQILSKSLFSESKFLITIESQKEQKCPHSTANAASCLMITFDFHTEETDKKLADLIKVTRTGQGHSLVLNPQTS